MKVAAAKRAVASQNATEEFKQQILRRMKRVAHGIAETFGPNCEVVLHDFDDLEHSIVWIEGNVTNRRVGGSVTDLGLIRIQAGQMDDMFNYTTHTKDGKTLKSSTMFLTDANNNTFGALCINVDISAFLAAERVLQSFTFRDHDQQIVETFSDDMQDILENLVDEAEREFGKPVGLMSKDERVTLIARLEKKGAFRVKRAVTLIADRMGVLRFTIYNYLKEAHLRSNGSD